MNSGSVGAIREGVGMAPQSVSRPPADIWTEMFDAFVTEIVRTTNIDSAANPEGITMNPDLRLAALNAALATATDREPAKQIVDRAQAYADFLTGTASAQ